MKKGDTSATISGAGDGKTAVEEKRKRASHRIRIRMYFNPKTFKLRDQEAVDKYLASYEFCLNLGIKIEFCPLMLTFPQPCLKVRVYIYTSSGFDTELRLPMTKFIHSVLLFYKVAPLSCRQ